MKAPGKLIFWNTDDDNGDKNADRTDGGATAGENDLAPIALSTTCPDAKKWKLTFPARVKVWKNANRTDAITSGTQYDVPLPGTLYVEGFNPSGGSGDVTLELTVYDDKGKSVGSDSVKATVVKVELKKCPNAFIPQGGSRDNTVNMRADVTPGAIKGKFKFKLTNVSSEKGFCLNAPNPIPANGEDSDAWKDLQFPEQNGFTIAGADKDQATTTANNLSTANPRVKSFDYGSYGRIEVEFEFNANTKFPGVEEAGFLRFTRIPLDADENDIADGAAQNSGPGASKAATDDNDDSPAGNGTAGDRLTRYEEYRGFHVGLSHVRTNVTKKNVFYCDFDSNGFQTYWNEGNLGAPIQKIRRVEMDASNLVTFNKESHAGPGQKAIKQRTNVPVANRSFFWGESTINIPFNLTENEVHLDNQLMGLRSGTVLDAAINAAAVTIVLTKQAADPGWAPAGKVKIENEIIEYTTVAVGATTITLTGVTRGIDGTAAAAHAAGARTDYHVDPDDQANATVTHEAGHGVKINHDASNSVMVGIFPAAEVGHSHDFRHAGAVVGSTQEFAVK